MMRRARSILVIEDDPATADIIRLYAEHAGYTVAHETDGRSGLARALRDPPDLIVLDVLLPTLDGMQLCRLLRRESDAPVIMLTARTTEDDKIEGLDAGADDYVSKPFSPRELIARIEAVLRRAAEEGPRRRQRFEFDGLTVDARTREVVVEGQGIALTPAEFDLLLAFCRSAGDVLSRSDLIARAFGFDYEGAERSIDAHVAKLRRKLRLDGRGPERIATVFGVGYRFIGVPHDA